MPVSRTQEIWALVLWVERTHGKDGANFISGRIAHFDTAGPRQAAAMWKQVSSHYQKLEPSSAPPD